MNASSASSEGNTPSALKRASDEMNTFNPVTPAATNHVNTPRHHSCIFFMKQEGASPTEFFINKIKYYTNKQNKKTKREPWKLNKIT
jgi:hypothetical protein